MKTSGYINPSSKLSGSMSSGSASCQDECSVCVPEIQLDTHADRPEWSEDNGSSRGLVIKREQPSQDSGIFSSPKCENKTCNNHRANFLPSRSRVSRLISIFESTAGDRVRGYGIGGASSSGRTGNSSAARRLPIDRDSSAVSSRDEFTRLIDMTCRR